MTETTFAFMHFHFSVIQLLLNVQLFKFKKKKQALQLGKHSKCNMSTSHLIKMI